jgi:putative NADH-flavin reductase
MKLVVLGANGRTGQHVVRKALDMGVSVTAIVRSAAKRPKIRHERLSVAVGDPCDAVFLATVFRDQDAVISTLGGRRPSKKATSIYYKSAEAIAKAASDTGLKTVIVTSSALLFPPRRLLDRILMAIVHNVVHSATRMEQTLRSANLNVVIARCGFLTDAAESKYRAEPDSLPDNGSSVSRLSLARFLVDKVQQSRSGFQIYGVSGPAGS